MEQLPVDIVVQAIVPGHPNHLRDHLPLFQTDTPGGDRGRTDSLFDLEIAGGADRGADPLPPDKTFREVRAGGDVELPPLLLAEEEDLPAAAVFALHAEDPVLLGKMRLAFLPDQAVGKDDRFVGHGDPVERLPVVGIGDGGDIVTQTDPPQQGTHRKKEEGGNEFKFAAILCHETRS